MRRWKLTALEKRKTKRRAKGNEREKREWVL